MCSAINATVAVQVESESTRKHMLCVIIELYIILYKEAIYDTLVISSISTEHISPSYHIFPFDLLVLAIPQV